MSGRIIQRRGNVKREKTVMLRLDNVALTPDAWGDLRNKDLPRVAIRLSLEDSEGAEMHIIYNHKDLREIANAIIALCDEWEDKGSPS
jgi:hypothetical protein